MVLPNSSQDSLRFLRSGSFGPLVHVNSREREVDVREAPNRKSGGIFGIYNPCHTYTHMESPSTFFCHSDASEPLYGETLAPLEQIAHIIDRSPEDCSNVQIFAWMC